MPLLKEKKRPALVTALIETFGFSPRMASLAALFLVVIFAAAVVWVVRSAPPSHIVMTSGPEGSSFQRWALAYQKALAAHGVTLEIRPSGGSVDNLDRLQDRKSSVDLGFVSGGFAKDENLAGLVSLGSVAYQPLWLFYRSAAPITRLSELTGKRVAVGAPGTGTHAVAVTLLQANGISGAPTTFVESDAEAAANDLLSGKLDAVFLMGDSAPTQILRNLVRAPDILLFHYSQAEAYLRRHTFLNRMELPEGTFDLGKNLPAQRVTLIGPSVDLIARENLNSALSDLLLEVAKQVHGNSGLMQKRGEFPAPLEHEIPLSEDAQRYYKTGKTFVYRSIQNFWLASLINRLVVVVVPLVLVIIPVFRLLPLVYRMSVQLRIYRCYRPLLRLERQLYAEHGAVSAQASHFLEQLDEIETQVDRLRVPASFADQYYSLRSHVTFVRQRLRAMATKT